VFTGSIVLVRPAETTKNLLGSNEYRTDEQGIMNVEGENNDYFPSTFGVPCSIFDIDNYPSLPQDRLLALNYGELRSVRSA
jgi:hypothetical protein